MAKSPASKQRRIPYQIGSQLTGNQKPNLTAGKTYNSVDEAIRNGSSYYKDKDGTVKKLTIKSTKVANTWEIGSTPLASVGRATRNSANSRPTRRRSSYSSTVNPPGRKEDLKIGQINKKGFQFHHIMDLDSYQRYFQGLSRQAANQLTQALNKVGFYPGEDRRNYIGLGGNQMMIKNQKVTIKRSEHQGDIHPRLSQLRRQYPLESPDNLMNMTITERYNAMLPHLIRDRNALQEVVRTRRRPTLNSNSKIPQTPKVVPLKPSYGGRTNNAGVSPLRNIGGAMVLQIQHLINQRANLKNAGNGIAERTNNLLNETGQFSDRGGIPIRLVS